MLNTEEEKNCIEKVIDNLKVKGTFDQLRQECMADVDIKPSYKNLLQRVEGYVLKFLCKQLWSSSLVKAQLRNRLRNEIYESDTLKNGIQHLISQVVNENITNQFSVQIKEALNEYLGIHTEEKSEEKNTNDNKISKDTTNDTNDANDITNNTKEKENQTNIKIEIEESNNLSKCNDEKPMTASTSMLTANDADLNVVDMDIQEDFEPLDAKPSPQVYESKIIVKDEDEHIQQAVNDDSKIFKEKEIDIKLDIKSSDEDSSFYDIHSKNPKAKEDSLKIKQEKIETDIKMELYDSDISDVSSVHTSDLSDFDDQISIDGSDSDEEKRKISLQTAKRIKELAQNPEASKQINPKVEKLTPEENNKRIRKKNPKFTSEEYSLRNLKMKKSTEVNETVDKETKIKRKRNPDLIETSKEPKLVRQNSKNSIMKKTESISQQLNSSNNQSSNMNNKIKKTNSKRNERYDSSDLYKPRYRIASSRRGRSLVDPQSPCSISDDNADK